MGNSHGGPTVSTAVTKRSFTGATNFDIVGLLPEEAAFIVLGNLELDDLRSVRLVCRQWAAIGDSDPVWRHKCKLLWWSLQCRPMLFPSWKETFKVIRYGTCIANEQGIPAALEHLATYNLLQTSSPEDVGGLLNDCRLIDKTRAGQFLSEHHLVMEQFFKLQEFSNVFLPEAMRTVFSKARFPCASSLSMAPVVRMFVDRYVECNPEFADDKNQVYILCYSVILLGVDLTNPHVKTKMTKREYFKNHRGILSFDEDYFIRIYDDVYIHGHVVEPRKERPLSDALKTIAS